MIDPERDVSVEERIEVLEEAYMRLTEENERLHKEIVALLAEAVRENWASREWRIRAWHAAWAPSSAAPPHDPF